MIRRGWRRWLLVLVLCLSGFLIAGAIHPPLLLSVGRQIAWRLRGARLFTVQVGGRTVAGAELGPEGGRPLLMIHGLGGEGLSLLPTAKALAGRGFRVVLIDLPGYGRSPRWPERMSIDSAGEIVFEAARNHGLPPKTAVFGHSLGGWIVAWQALVHPERWGPVILSAAAGLEFEPPPLNILSPRSVAEGRKNLELLFVKPPPIPGPIIWLLVKRPRPTNVELIGSALSGRYLLDGLLAGVSRPTLVLAGAQDRLIPSAVSRKMAREIPDAVYVEIPGAGHMLNWEEPEACARAIEIFLRSHPE